MPLDIDKLRLTKSEYYDVIRKVYIYATPSYPKEVIDAQLAKALWGMVEWVKAYGAIYAIPDLILKLEDELLDVGIPRPEVMKEA